MLFIRHSRRSSQKPVDRSSGTRLFFVNRRHCPTIFEFRFISRHKFDNWQRPQKCAKGIFKSFQTFGVLAEWRNSLPWAESSTDTRNNLMQCQFVASHWSKQGLYGKTIFVFCRIYFIDSIFNFINGNPCRSIYSCFRLIFFKYTLWYVIH